VEPASQIIRALDLGMQARAWVWGRGGTAGTIGEARGAQGGRGMGEIGFWRVVGSMSRDTRGGARGWRCCGMAGGFASSQSKGWFLATEPAAGWFRGWIGGVGALVVVHIWVCDVQ